MSHFPTLTPDKNGHILDQRFKEELQTVASNPFAFTDVFLFSFGWSQSALGASAGYNAFSLGFARALQGLLCASPAQWPKIAAAFQPLALAPDWPATLARNHDRTLNIREPDSFLALQRRADEVGQQAGHCTLRLMIERQREHQPYRFNLIGHGFGCRVLCAALQALAENTDTAAKLAANEFNVVLIQPAIDADALAPGRLYGKVQASIPQLRVLVTTSENDLLLGKWYPEAQRFARDFSSCTDAMGVRGPAGELQISPDQKLDVTNAIVPSFSGRMCVANLTPLHQSTATAFGSKRAWGGQHGDINLPQLYDLLARFFAK